MDFSLESNTGGIWNEPYNRPHYSGYNQIWTGTAEQFYELYYVTAKHLKSCFGDSIKIGGYGASGLYGIYYHPPEKYGGDVPKIESDGVLLIKNRKKEKAR